MIEFSLGLILVLFLYICLKLYWIADDVKIIRRLLHNNIIIAVNHLTDEQKKLVKVAIVELPENPQSHQELASLLEEPEIEFEGEPK